MRIRVGIFLWICSITSALAAVTITTREEWGAKPALLKRTPPIDQVKSGPLRVKSENTMPLRGTAKYLTVHHTGTPYKPQPFDLYLKNFQALMQRGYEIDSGAYKTQVYLGDVPYHFFIDETGLVAAGRELKFAAYSNTVYATPIEQHITVVLKGNFESQEPTPQQLSSLTDLLERLAREHAVPLRNIGYHKMAAVKGSTSCPGINVISKMETITQNLAQRGIR
jgi:hypothetical protein